MKVYIASPFFNEDQLRTVMEIENTLSISKIDHFSPRLFGVISEMTPEEKAHKMQSVYQANVDNIKDCDAMVAVVDWPDTGTIFELGYAACLREVCENDKHFGNRKIITFSNTGKPVNVMLRYGIDAHAKGVIDLGDILWHYSQGIILPKFMKNFPDVNE